MAQVNEAMGLLQKETELEEIVKLVGVDALAASDRLVLEAARSIREDFLQQNAFEDGDSYTALDTQYALLGMILNFYHKALAALEKGADVQKIADLSVRERIGRAKSSENFRIEYPDIEREVDEQLSDLTARSY